jgi:hypothetical protein
LESGDGKPPPASIASNSSTGSATSPSGSGRPGDNKGDLEMNKFKNPMITAAVLAGLALIGSFMNSHPSVLQAAGGPIVTIDPSQLPLPITGTVSISGAPQPVAFRISCDPVRTTPSTNTANFSDCVADGPTVPAGKRLVVEQVTVFCRLSSLEYLVQLWISPKNNPDAQNFLILSPAPTERTADLAPYSVQYGYSRPVKAYFEAGQTLQLETLTASPLGSTPTGTVARINAYVHGYYVAL